MKKRLILFLIGSIFFAGIILYLIWPHANPSNRNQHHDIEQGRVLASRYCQSCHLLPDPSLLDKANWKKLLPEMGVRLGIYTSSVKIPDEDRHLFPAASALDIKQWQDILDYYNAAAPDLLPAQKRELEPQPADRHFAALLPPESMFRKDCLISCVKMDNSVKPGRLFVYDATHQMLYLFSRSGLLDSVRLNDAIVDIEIKQGSIFACSIGKSLQVGTSNNRFGKVFPMHVSAAGKLQIKPALIDGLARPVQALPSDIDGDGKTDLIVCEFGGIEGSLSWYENKGGGKYQRHLIRDVSGSVSVSVVKEPNSNVPDLWVLFAQGEEGIFHFTNKGKGTFDVKEVLRFPPSFGSTSFCMADVNGDGFKDIIYSSGDNGDVTTVLKPYHGVYVYVNDGNENFTQKFFYPMHGCYKVIAADFSHSGRIDLAAIAYFTDASRPEFFVYLKNEGQMKFSAYKAPAEVNFDSALTMDLGDFDNDGKPDLFIGNALDGEDQNTRGAPFAVLKNNF